MSTTESLPPALARRLAVHAQLLAGSPGAHAGASAKEQVARIIGRLGYVQIDTIAVIRRAHHHTLWSRHPAYAPRLLHELQAQDRRVFEYWGHAASYLPMADYRYYLRRMQSYRAPPTSKWEKERLVQYGPLLEPVLQRIREEGPLRSQDFDPPPGARRGSWWDWKPAKMALERLFWQGELMVTERHNFQRVYDLTERVLPAHIDTTMPDDHELGAFLVQRALAAYGVATRREIQQHIHAAPKPIIDAALDNLVEAGQVLTVQVEGDDETLHYALPATVAQSAEAPPPSPQVTLLSPFDNLIIQRDRTQRLFDFYYRLECYTPAAKRQYGYFVLPILQGDELVGRLDPKAEHKTRTLQIRSLLLEPHTPLSEALLSGLAQAVADLARFNRCDRVAFQTVEPEKIRTALLRRTEQALESG